MTVENVLNRQFLPKSSSKFWVLNITYIHTNKEFLHLTTIIDLSDRKIIGWSLYNTMSIRDAILSAWRMATRNRTVEAGLIFYSDRGVQVC